MRAQVFIFGSEPGGVLSLTPLGEPVSFRGPYLITASTVRLGSSKDSEVWVDDPRVQDHHARLEVTDLGVYLVDLKSPEGTFLNGKRITRALLRDGDSIRLVAPGRGATARPASTPAPTPAPGGPLAVELLNKSVPVSALPVTDTLVSNDPTRWHGSTLRFDSSNLPDPDRLKVEVLLSVSTALARPEPIEKKLSRVVELMLKIMDFDRAAIAVLREHTSIHDPEFIYQAQATSSGNERTELSGTVIRKVLQEEQGVVIKDALFHTEFGKAQSVRAQAIRTCVCFPLKTQSALLGVLYADSQRSSESLTEEDLLFISAFAAQAAVAVENALLSSRIEREAVMRSRLERFFPPSAVSVMHDADLGGQEMLVTVLFCDIRNYTRLSQELSARQVAHMLNDYFSALVKIVFRHEGTLEKYIGDALVAIWGAPLSMATQRQVLLAARAAFEMQSAVAALNQGWAQTGGPRLEIGIGINSGTAFVGNIGDESYLQYAAIGSSTNLAARLCSCAGPGQVILSESSVRELPPELARVQPLGDASLKGFADSIPTFLLHHVG